MVISEWVSVGTLATEPAAQRASQKTSYSSLANNLIFPSLPDSTPDVCGIHTFMVLLKLYLRKVHRILYFLLCFFPCVLKYSVFWLTTAVVSLRIKARASSFSLGPPKVRPACPDCVKWKLVCVRV